LETKAFAPLHPGVSSLFGLALAGLYLISLGNYLLFHSIAETFSIFVAFGVFVVSLYTPRKSRSFSFFIIIGTGFLFTGGLDFLHMQSYRGMGVFQGHGADTATQLWIAARSLETLTFLAAILFLNRRADRKIVWTAFAVLFFSLVAIIFFSGIFPACFVEGQGLTVFKIASEFIICSFLVLCLILLKRRSGTLPRNLEKLVAGAIALTIASEICFVFYLDPYGTFNFLGHLFKIAAFFLLYKAAIEKNFVLPRGEMKEKLTEKDKKLSADKRFLEDVINALTHPFCVIDANNHRITMANRAILDQFGGGLHNELTCHRLIYGKNEPCTSRKQTCPLEIVLKTRKPVVLEHTRYQENHRERIIQIHGFPFFDEAGNIPWMIQYSFDITKMKKLERTLKKEVAFNRILSGLARKIIAAKSIEDVSGFVLEKAKTFTDSSFGFAGYIDRETGFLVSPTLTETVWDRCRVQGKDHIFSEFSGLWGWVLENREPLYTNEVAADPRSTGVPPGHIPIDSFLSVPAMIGGELVGQIAVANSARAYEKKDISDLEKIAHLYAISINEKQRIAEIQKAKNEAESANEAKTLFLANMSHEIRTPLNAVSGFAQLLRDSLQGSLNSRQENYVVHIIEAGNRLTELLNDILDISRIESGETRIKAAPFSVQGLVREVKGVLLGLNHDNRLSCHVQADDSLPETLEGDHDRIMQVLTNFISNAVKFTEQGTVTVSVEKCSDEKIMFKVSDTGIGLPEDVHSRLFDKFYQADSSYTRQYQGAGLGLSISKELVELMGGTIGFESQPGTGSDFYFILDLPGQYHRI